MRRDRVLLFFPRTGWDEPEATILPLGLVTLSLPLRRAGFEPLLVDSRVHADWRSRIEKAVEGGDVACVGISSMTGPQIGHALEATRIVKSASPATPVVWGGVHPSLLPEQTLAQETIDALVVGEGDAAFPRLVGALAAGRPLTGLPGIAFREGRRAILTPAPPPTPLDDLAQIDYEAAPLSLYRPTLFGTPAASLPVVTSRGCPYRCAYCYNLSFDRRRWRAMTSGRTVEMLLDLSRRFSTEHFFLLDDAFFVDPDRVRGICEGLVAAGSRLALHNANCRVDQVRSWDRSFLELLRRAGLRRLFIGAESGSDAVLERMEKGHRAADVLDANERLRKAGIAPSFSFMAGLPYETWEDVRATVRLMAKLLCENPSAWVLPLSLYSPFPGTPLLDDAIRAGFRQPRTLEGWIQVRYDTSSLPQTGRSFPRLLERAHYLSTFLDPKVADRPAACRPGPLKRLLALAARARLRRGWIRFVPEMWVIEKARVARRG